MKGDILVRFLAFNHPLIRVICGRDKHLSVGAG
jgi:uncharacterized protein